MNTIPEKKLWIEKPQNKEFKDYLVKKKSQNVNIKDNEELSKENDKQSEAQSGLHNICNQMMHNNYSDIKNLVFLDSDSIIIIFNNKNMVSNIKKGLSNINIRTNKEGHLKAVTACKVLDLEFKSY